MEVNDSLNFCMHLCLRGQGLQVALFQTDIRPTTSRVCEPLIQWFVAKPACHGTITASYLSGVIPTLKDAVKRTFCEDTVRRETIAM